MTLPAGTRLGPYGSHRRARIHPDRATLDAAYRAAARDPWRKRFASDWSGTETEDWPK